MWERLLRGIAVLPFVLFVVSFWDHIAIFVRWFTFGSLPMPLDVAESFSILGINILWFFIFFLIWLFLAADQTIFPVNRLGQVVQTAVHLILHYLRLHGVAAYVRNGRFKAYVEELHLRLPGALLVDFNSAVAVERIVLPMGLRRGLTNLVRRLAGFFRIELPPIRIQGAGLTFLLPDERVYGVNDLEAHPLTTEDPYWMERILGVVDLRTQFRISVSRPHPLSKRLGSPILAYTRDGIEVSTNIWVLATLGHDPAPYFPLTVIYIGDRQPLNLQVVKLQPVAERPGMCRVESLTDDLDEADRFEIHQKWQALGVWIPYQSAPSPAITPRFNSERVFAAVYGRARHHRGLGGADEIVPWVDLPIHVGIDFFREIISRYNYDEIYSQRFTGNMGISEIRDKLASDMRNSGLLAVRPVFHSAGISLQAGREYPISELLTVRPQDTILLQNPKVLRDRGTRLIACGFGDLSVDEAIYKQRLDHWRAAWDQETDIVEAGLEWESTRNRTRARIQAQQDFVACLAQIYQSGANSKEILALRVLQALEVAATDPKTRQLLPEDTFSMLRSIHDWLLPQNVGLGSTDS